jgi:hypothetical protein
MSQRIVRMRESPSAAKGDTEHARSDQTGPYPLSRQAVLCEGDFPTSVGRGEG